ncbi:DUF4833 domain-containing protein [Parabacteroides sp. PF5-9]|uniref:DUF4833 domain-containing protein n=1 Tax=Parabacteroides sp. PF5-9 TaxID=1742404 RepID=UPI0024751C36|nr:DUF4833 domain-containing protein [Parabacteroides sp. PF5-9]MDH6358503.1 hypothetical protein [Parabacteroides sp. PF5-9]
MRKDLLFFLYLSVLVLPFRLVGQDQTYPTPSRLFYIERSKNKNLVCYDVQLKDGQLDAKNPMSVYWVNREESPGEKKELSAIQRRLAYGYKVVSQEEDRIEVTLSAYPGRNLSIQRLDGKYVCVLLIDNQLSQLQSLFVKAKEGNSLSVEYVELRGVAIATKDVVVERVKK